MKRTRLVPIVSALLAAAVTAGATLAAGGGSVVHIGANSHRPYSIGLWGDLPYSIEQATVGMPNLIADINSQKLAFTVNDGDLKAGSSDSDAVYAQAQLFFSTPFTLGQHTLRQEVQATPLCKTTGGTGPCVENRRWRVGDVTYATFNVQGSCNNRCDISPDEDEYTARNAADIAWLHDTFDEATAHDSAAVMLIVQADPGWDDSDVTRAPTRDPRTLAEDDGLPDGFQPFLSALRDEVIAFRKPVAFVNGDSHYFRIVKPFEDASGRRLENFTRSKTVGDHQENGTNDMNWLKVTVDPRTREVFSYQQQIVPANRVAVPAP